MRKLLLIPLLLLCAPLARANQAVRGWCEVGAQPVVTSGLHSSTQVQQSFPQCSVTVFIHGGGLASIFSDNSGTPLANPFTATSNGQWQFYAANGHYDILLTFTGSTPPAPVTYSDVLLADPANQQAALPNTSISFSATPDFPSTNNASYTLTLTGNVTSSTASGTPANGNLLSLTLIEDAIGGRTMTFPNNFNLPLGFSFNTLPLATNAFTWKFDGTHWNLISNGGSGAGSNPQPPTNSLQKNNGLGALAASTVVDDGTKVNVNEDFNPIGPNPYVDIRAFGAVACNPNTTPCAVGLTATISLGSPTTATISSASTFANGNGVVIYGAGPLNSLSTPVAPTVTNDLAAGGTGTGVVTASAPGSTTKCYKITARDTMGGETAASPETCSSTGQSTLGAITINNTSYSRSGTTVTVTTSTAHPVLVGTGGGEVFVTGATDPSFNGWYPVATATDSTHYTWTNPVASIVNGSPASATGGTSTFYPTNHLSWTHIANAWNYYIYCGASGAEILCGASNPDGTNLDDTWDDFANLQTNWQFPLFIPTTPPTSATADNLSTTIVSGAGTTTLTLANAATTAVTNATIRLDAAPAIRAAATASGGSFFIPLDASGNLFVVNSFVDLRSFGGVNVAQSGGLFVNDTIAIALARWQGFANAPIGGIGLGSWSGGKPAFIVGNGARPGLYISNGSAGSDIRLVSFSGCNSSNGCLLVLSEGGFSFNFDTLDFSTGQSSNDLMGIGLYLRGSVGQSAASVILDKVAFAAGNVSDGTSHNPTFYCNICGDVHVREAYSVHRGMAFSSPSAGGNLQIDNWHINGGGTPFLSVVGGLTNNVSLGNVIMDTIAHPCVSVFASNVNVQTNGCGGSSGITAITGGSILSVAGTGMGVNTRISSTIAGQVSPSPAPQVVAFRNDGPISVSPDHGTIFVAGAVPATPTTTLNAGGSLTIGIAFRGYVVPVWANGLEGTPSSASNTVTTTTGNQSITVTGTALSNPAPQCYNIYVSENGGGAGIPNTISSCLASPTATVTSISFFSQVLGPIPQAGPTTLLGGSQGTITPSLGITDGGFTSSQTFNGTANRSVTWPDLGGTPAFINAAQTWTANQSVANGNSIRWFSNNGTNYAGFTGGASTTNLVWLFPTTDSTGTQCLSSNGSLQLAWSACSAGTGTPGGASTDVQFNNAGSFGGSGNLTWVSPTLTIGAAGSTTGQLAMTGATSGTVTVTPQAVAGSPTLTFPNATGTLADGASSPLSLSATTGNLTCPTCTTNASALTNNQIVLGAGGQAVQAGPAGTTTTVLHGNASGIPSYGAVALATDVSGTLPITNGGTGQPTASAAFNALSPITTTGDLILGTGTNAAGRLGIGTNGLCLVSNGTTATWNSCAAGAVGGTATAGQGAFWTASSSIGGSANWTYSSSSGHSMTQGANGADAFYMKRFTDSSPAGNFLHFQNNAANSDIAKLDVSGNLSVAGSLAVTGSTVAGNINLNQGPAPNLVANNVTLAAPTAVSASGEEFSFPGTAATGFIRWTNSTNVLTGAFVPASGIGACVNTVVTATNDNTPPTCGPVTGPMFGTQAANQVWASPNGTSGNMTVRSLLSGDIPTINLNLGGNGGITGTLPIGNGGTNAVTAIAAFNNLSPLTTAGDLLYGGTAGAGTRLAAGTSTQVLHSGTTPSWATVTLTTDVTGVLPFANGGTNASSGLTNTNGVIYSNGTSLVSTATGGAGTLCLTSVSGGVPSFSSCSGSAATSWSSLTNPSANLSLSMGADTTTFTWGAATGSSVNPFTITDTASNTGTGDLVLINTASSSALNPFRAAAKGTSNGVEMSTSGVLASIGSGSITANTLNQALNTSSPLAGGGTQTSALTLTCTSCVTSGSSLTNNLIVVGSGGGQGTASLASGSSGQILQSAGASAPAWITYPDTKYSPAANCVNSTAGSAWSTGATPAALCRAGSNNLSGLLSPWGASDIAQVVFHIPKDADLTTNLPALMLEITSTDATNAHTIIMQESVSCEKEDGSTTDDVAFNAARSFGTITLNGNANRLWQANITLNSTDLTGCSAPGLMIVKVSRTTDTATNVGIYGLSLTTMRLLTVQAN